jgi:hypothetical protein
LAYSAADAREQILDEITVAIEAIGLAIGALGDAYEALDEHLGDRLEAELFRPAQAAYGRAQRTHAEFAARHGLPGEHFEPTAAGRPSQGVKGFLDTAVGAISQADGALSSLQDSMLPVEVGDAELRAGLSEVRRTLADLPSRARQLARVIGR